MELIKSLKGISFDLIFESFKEAFSDYEVQVNKEELQTMLIRRGFNPELSFAAFKDGKIISFTLNGIGVFNGKKTAYDTGSGTLKEYWGQGLATKIFKHSIPFLKEAGVYQYLLEVLQHNKKAVSVYKKIGFEISREFNYYVPKNEEYRPNEKIMQSGYRIEQISKTESESMIKFCDFNPSWQNSFDAINRNPGDFLINGVFKEHKLLGYCVFEPISGDVTQIAVDKEYRRSGIATNLINEALKHNKRDSFKILNTDTNCESITKFIEANSIIPNGKQFEMIKQL
ncbi:MAG: GNAT family N-acetyltransferase [Bacteroidales bacterium]|nr:GNAT family N-acetyltransferase [Bacteroidales bacterium]